MSFIEIDKVPYLTMKQVSKRYGFSVSWFKKRRQNKLMPYCTKFNNKGKVLYPLDQTDRWFKENIILKENY